MPNGTGSRIGNECVSGHAPSERPLHLVWKGSDGSPKANTYISTGYGYWSYCSDDGAVLAAGDFLKATVGSTTRQFVMPNLTITVDRVHDVFRGRGPAGATLNLYYIYNGCCMPHEQHVEVTVDAQGRWAYDDDSPTQGASADLYWASAKGDTVYAASSAPEVAVFIGRAIVSGVTADRGDPWKLVLRDPTTGLRKGVAQGTADEWGSFAGVFLDAAGHPVTVMPGDRVVGTSLAADMDFIVRDIRATADVVTDVVTGKCGNGEMLYVTVGRDGRQIGGTWFAARTADGGFRIDFSDEEDFGYDPANIRHGDRLVVTCETKPGDFIQKSIRVP